MKTRKIVLLAGIAFLAVVCVIQAILAGRNPVKTLKFEETPDLIVISKNDSQIKLSLDGSDWYVGDDDFKVNQSDISTILSNVKEIKILDNVGRLASEELNERWDLNDEKAITVTATKAGKELRSIKVGKASSTGSQTFITTGTSKDVLLVNGNLNSIFSKSEDALKSKSVFTLPDGSVNAVKVELPKASWSVEKTAVPDSEITWTFQGSAAGKEADESKVLSWVRQISSCTASSWYDDKKSLPSKKEASVELSGTDGKTTIDIYSFKEGDKDKYVAVSNKTSHKFELSETTAKRYIKDPEDLVK